MRIFGRTGSLQVGSLDLSVLAFKFKVTRSLYGYAGTAEIEVRNPNEQHRREILSMPRYHTFIELQAGYVEGKSLLFRGDLRKCVPVRDNTDWILKITAGDGEHALRNARVNRSFASGATIQHVVQHIVDVMGVGAGNAMRALRGARLGSLDGTFPEGTVLQGRAADELTRLCASANLTWSIQDGNLQILPRGGALDREAILLSASTGLQGVPEVVSRRCIACKAFLVPGLVPGQRVVVESAVVTAGTRPSASGAWRISAAEYTGDTWANDWAAALTLHRPAPSLLSPGTIQDTSVE